MEAAILTPSGRIALGTTTLNIGSDAGNELSLNDTQAAPVHAEIALVEGAYQLTDLGSSQGTLVNGQAIAPHTPVLLHHGDTISIGATSLTFEMSTQAENEITSFSTVIDEIPTARTPSVTLQQPLAEAATLAINEETPTELPSDEISEAVTAIIPAHAEAPAASVPQQAETPAPAETPLNTPLPQAETPVPPVPPTTPAPLYAALHLPLDANGQPIPQAVPLQAFAPMGYPVQPGYLPQPGQLQTASTTAPAAKKRGRVLLWVALIIVVLLLLAGSNTATYALTHPQTPKPVVHTPPSPNGTLRTYCQGILTSNSEEIYDLLSDQAKIHTSLDDIQQKFNSIKLLNSGSSSLSASYTDCTFSNVRTSDTLAVATVSLTIAVSMKFKTQDGTTNETTTLTAPSLTSMVWEKGQWKIDYSLISQPQPTFSINGVTITPTTTP